MLGIIWEYPADSLLAHRGAESRRISERSPEKGSELDEHTTWSTQSLSDTGNLADRRVMRQYHRTDEYYNESRDSMVVQTLATTRIIGDSAQQ
jgi:hypothetical protein